MAVGDTTGITGLLQNPDVIKMLNNVLPNVLGDNSMNESGSGLGVIGGALAGFIAGKVINNNDTANAAALGAHALTSADVQNIVSANTNSQTLGNVEGEIWKAEGQLQAALAGQSNTNQITTLNAEIANLQGQSGILASIGNAKGDVINEVHETGDVVSGAIGTLAAATAAAFGNVNTNIASITYATSLAISNDGEKTRAAVALLAASIPNSRELDLQRQLAVALDDHRHTNTRGVIDSGNVSVITNVATSQAQQQQQAQFAALTGVVGQLVAAQHATNTAITIGNGNRPNQTATNVNG